ncbi:hypothetical protein AYI70_g10513 [Smittium culicis]|uniref:Uncharacterized protein n=1 Tax=Smittium culicis TaxID=133412 RepID=A0A1R1X698_9FUNG|nr:hypothetical protein AYI70_g10513 [Smittium culicis]
MDVDFKSYEAGDSELGLLEFKKLCGTAPFLAPPRSIEDFSEKLVSLHQDQRPSASDLCVIRTKFSGRPKKTDSTNRMFYIAGDILSTELETWTPRRRPLCIIPKQEAGSMLQFLPGQQSAWTEFPESKMEDIRQSVLLFTL